MNDNRINRHKILSALPPEWPEDPQPAIQALLALTPQKLAILDDDPTGSQLVRNIPVLTEWSTTMFRKEFENALQGFFILTNSRGMHPTQAFQTYVEIGEDLAIVERATGTPISVISRGDSTLRGHFPGEMDALSEGMDTQFDAWFLIPALPEEGRITIDDIHYVTDGEWLIPTGESTYAKDSAFGYHSSNLREWVKEKSAGRFDDSQIFSISIQDIRIGGPEKVLQKLLSAKGGSIFIANAACRRDLEVVAQAALMAEAGVKKYLYRSGPSFVSARIGLSTYPPLESAQINLPTSGAGLIMVGSYVPNTTRQVNELLQHGDVEGVEVQVENLLSPHAQKKEIFRAAAAVDKLLLSGRDTVLYTSRNLVAGSEASTSLDIGRKVSTSLIRILDELRSRPRYLLAKGGITSNDIATRGLGVKRVMVLGQIIHGVSVWELGPESRFPGLAYLVFPGNVGSSEGMLQVINKLKKVSKD